jgi:hypothetical protein
LPVQLSTVAASSDALTPRRVAGQDVVHVVAPPQHRQPGRPVRRRVVLLDDVVGRFRVRFEVVGEEQVERGRVVGGRLGGLGEGAAALRRLHAASSRTTSQVAEGRRVSGLGGKPSPPCYCVALPQGSILRDTTSFKRNLL